MYFVYKIVTAIFAPVKSSRFYPKSIINSMSEISIIHDESTTGARRVSYVGKSVVKNTKPFPPAQISLCKFASRALPFLYSTSTWLASMLVASQTSGLTD